MGSRAGSEPQVRRRDWLECMRLWVKDVDFVHNQIVVRDGNVHKLHAQDLQTGAGHVYLPKDGEVAPWFQSPLYRVMRFFGRHRDEMADAVIEAFFPWFTGRAGARKTRRLILLLAVGWLPPSLRPSSAYGYLVAASAVGKTSSTHCVYIFPEGWRPSVASKLAS
jgi:hypothetical protein